jgi:hypothetical protein
MWHVWLHIWYGCVNVGREGLDTCDCRWNSNTCNCKTTDRKVGKAWIQLHMENLFCCLTYSMIYAYTCMHTATHKTINWCVEQSGLTERNAIQLWLLAASFWSLTWHTLWLWRWRQCIPLKRQWTSTGLYTISPRRQYSSYVLLATYFLSVASLVYP